MAHDRVYWVGKHASRGWGACVGKLHREGMQVLRQHGWREVSTCTDDIPAFCWMTRRSGDFPASGDGLPLVRQLPQEATAALDDKRFLALSMIAAGCEADIPPTHVDVGALLERLEGDAAAEETLWFLKHRHGVKGQGVVPLHGLTALRRVVDRMDASKRGQFVVQAEVPPLLLADGRRFAMRSHVLLDVGREARRRPRAWHHRDVLLLPHAAAYAPRSDCKAVHVSQAGKNHPRPFLLGEQRKQQQQQHAAPATAPEEGAGGVAGDDVGIAGDTAGGGGRVADVTVVAAGGASEAPIDCTFSRHVDEARVRERMGSLVWRSLRAARGSLVPRPRCARSHLYALLAYDWVLDARGEPVLLEVNSHPAIADGTMAAVPRDVYTTLVRDVLGALVLPALEGRPPEPGGFEPVDGWAG